MLVPPRGDRRRVAVLRAAARRAVERGADGSGGGVPAGARWRSRRAARSCRRVLIELGGMEALRDGIGALEHLGAAYDS